MDARAWDERYAADGLVWSAGPNVFVEGECRELEPGRALDLGAGEGRNAIWLARHGWSVTAVDFSQVALGRGRELAGDVPVEWVRADATTWRGSSYDLAVLAYLQLPAAERRLAVRAAYDALAPGGTFLLVAHDSSNLAEGTGGPKDPTVLMTADDVLTDLEGRAYDVLRAGRAAREVEPGHRGEPARIAWDCVVKVRSGRRQGRPVPARAGSSA